MGCDSVIEMSISNVSMDIITNSGKEHRSLKKLLRQCTSQTVQLHTQWQAERGKSTTIHCNKKLALQNGGGNNATVTHA